jgi:hypothetical protein
MPRQVSCYAASGNAGCVHTWRRLCTWRGYITNQNGWPGITATFRNGSTMPRPWPTFGAEGHTFTHDDVLAGTEDFARDDGFDGQVDGVAVLAGGVDGAQGFQGVGGDDAGVACWCST